MAYISQTHQFWCALLDGLSELDFASDKRCLRWNHERDRHENIIMVIMSRIKRTGRSPVYLDTGAKPGHATYATRYGVLSV